MLNYEIIPVTAFEQNCSLVWCTETLEAALVDPGGDIDTKLLPLVESKQVQLKQILLTHAHIDHAGAAGELSRRLQIPIFGPHPEDQFWIDALAEQAQMFGFPAAEMFTPKRWIDDGDTVSVGNQTLHIRHVPGHTPGHVFFYEEGIKTAWVGDVLFRGSIGRTDFPRGNYEQLIVSIKNKLLSLGDDYRFVPGHGPESTLGYERKTNPFLVD